MQDLPERAVVGAHRLEALAGDLARVADDDERIGIDFADDLADAEHLEAAHRAEEQLALLLQVPAARLQERDAAVEVVQDALGDLVLYLDGWQYSAEEVREGGVVAYYAFSLAQNRERGDVTLQMDIPVGGYDYGGFPLDAPQTVTAGAFTLVYEEHIAQDGADFTAQACGLVQRGGVPRIYVTQFYGVNANFQETLTALLGTRGET